MLQLPSREGNVLPHFILQSQLQWGLVWLLAHSQFNDLETSMHLILKFMVVKISSEKMGLPSLPRIRSTKKLENTLPFSVFA